MRFLQQQSRTGTGSSFKKHRPRGCHHSALLPPNEPSSTPTSLRIEQAIKAIRLNANNCVPNRQKTMSIVIGEPMTKDTQLAPSQVPPEKTTKLLEPMALGLLEPNAQRPSSPYLKQIFKIMHTRELSRLSIGGCLAVWMTSNQTTPVQSHLRLLFKHLKNGHTGNFQASASSTSAPEPTPSATFSWR